MVESPSIPISLGLEREIDYLLNRADLQKYREAFIRLGVHTVKRFTDVEDNNLESVVGLSKMEVQLLRQSFSEIQAESKIEDLLVESVGEFLYKQG